MSGVSLKSSINENSGKFESGTKSRPTKTSITVYGKPIFLEKM